MTFVKRTLGLTMLGALGLLFNTPHVGAAVVAGADTVQLPALANGQSEGSIMQLARKEKNFCPINTYLLRSAETKNFAVQICSTEGGTFSYVGLDKNSSKSITLPARSLSSTYNKFAAVNGDITYTIDPSLLTVRRGNKTLARERVVRWFQGNGLRG